MSGRCQDSWTRSSGGQSRSWEPVAFRAWPGAVEDPPASRPSERARGPAMRKVRIEVGCRRLTAGEAELLGHGSTVRLTQRADAPVNVYVDDCLAARGQLLLVDGRLAVRITELVSHNDATNRNSPGPDAGDRGFGRRLRGHGPDDLHSRVPERQPRHAHLG